LAKSATSWPPAAKLRPKPTLVFEVRLFDSVGTELVPAWAKVVALRPNQRTSNSNRLRVSDSAVR
jgi:hypothetical protein